MNSSFLLRLVPLSVCLVLAVACRDSAPPSPAAPAVPPRVSSEGQGTPFDLGEVVRRVHFAYRADGDGWTASDGTWSARATAEGLTFTPRHSLKPAPRASHPEPRTRRAAPEPAEHVLTGRPVTFGTPVLSRGGSALELPAARGTVSQEGSLAWARGEVEQQLHNSEAGVEQRLRFTRAPRGDGALSLRVPVSGLPLVAETASGVHFADEAGLGVRYGGATWTEASGKSTPLRARAVEGAVELRVPAELLHGSSFPALLAVGVGPEIGLDQPVTTPGSGSQTQPEVASNGTDYLVVWEDERNGPSADIYGARVSAAGVLLDPLGFAISTEDNSQENPAVIFDGTNYFVVWEDGRGSGVHIYGARVSPSGTVLDPTGLAISTTTAFNQRMYNPAVAFDGTNYLVVWNEQSGFTGPMDMYGTFVSGAGVAFDSFYVSVDFGDQTHAALAFDGTNYLAAWMDTRVNNTPNIRATRITPAGLLLDPGGFVMSPNTLPKYGPALAFNGTNYLVAWAEYRAPQFDIYGARVTPAGTVLDAAGLALVQGTDSQDYPQLVARGTEYLMTWIDYRSGNADIYASRVSAAGTMLDGQGVALVVAPDYQTLPSVATNGTGYLVAWQDPRTTDIYAGRMNLTGGVLDPNGFMISPAPNSEQEVAMAFDGTNYLVVWQDNRGQSVDLYGIRVSANGTVLDPSAFVISNAMGNQLLPSVAFDGTNYLVAWQDSRVSAYDIYAARVTPAGTVLDPNGILLCDRGSWQQRPKVAFDGINSLVVWSSSDANYTLIGTRVSKAGAVLDPAFITISSGPLGILDYSLGFDGTNYLAVWTDGRSSANHSEIYGARISRSGAVLDPTGIAITAEPQQQSQPVLGFDGTNYLVVYRDLQTHHMVARRLSRSGAVLDATPIPIAVSNLVEQYPSVTFDGTDFLLVWQRHVNFYTRDIYGGRVSRAGVPKDGGGFPISTGPMDDGLPAVISSSAGNALVVYQSRDPAQGPGLYRMKARRLSMTSNPPTASSSSVTTPEDVAAPVVLSASDPDNDPLSYTVSTPAHGTLTGTAPNLTYRPAANFHGTDSFTFTVSDGTATSAPATVSITVTPVADVPVASAQSVQTQEDSPKALTLTGTDGDGDALSFTVATGPSHGRLTGTAPNLMYVPTKDYHGPDSFTFTASDGQNTSPPGTVSITVTPQNDEPKATAQSLTTDEDVALPLVLTGLDWDGDALTFTVTSGPRRGTLTGTAPHLTYTPAPNYHGPDSFTFTVSDGQITSFPATVSISVTPVNDAPVAIARSATVEEDTPTVVVLSGSDEDRDDIITYAIASPPAHGTLTGTKFPLTYVPAQDYHGPDSFTFTVSDGQATSAPALVSIFVTPRNDAPVATARSLTVDEDSSAAVTLAGTDVEGDRLTFTVASPPAHGTLTGIAPNLTYRPAAHYNGPDSFTFTVSDSQAASAPATVSISVTARNDAPVASALSVTTDEDTPLSVTLPGTDLDADTLTFTVLANPGHGTLTGTAPNLTYTPAANYHGPDSFTFTVSDGQATSAPATVSVTVAPVNDAPVANVQGLNTPEDTAIPVSLSGTDAEGSRLTFTVSTQPLHGTLTGTVPHLTYTPAPNFNGADSFSFTVSDGQLSSARAFVSISVGASNDAPVALAGSVTLEEDTTTSVVLTGTDADGDTLSYTVATNPGHGTLTGTAPHLTYTPSAGYEGPDSFTFTVSDGQGTSAPAAVSISVLPGNDAPVAEPLALTVAAGHPTSLFLSGRDEDGDELTFAIVTAPDVGKLTGTPPDLVYTAPPSFRGTARFTFSVSDGRESSQAEAVLTVVKKGLTVSAAVDSRRPAERQPVRFYANAVDEAGAPITLTWDFGDGQTSREQLPLHTFAAPGVYDVRLKATTATEEATAMLRLRVRSFAPIALTPNAPATRTLTGEEGAVLSFRVDAAQPGLTYSWDFGDGTAATTGATASHEWDDDGRFTLRVTASDGSGTRWVATRSILIVNAPPVPLPQSALAARVNEPVSVQLAGSDAAGAKDPLQWELISGEGTLSPSGQFRWTPMQAGLATFVATVTDGDGGEARLAFQVAADSPPPVEPEPPPESGCGCGAGSDGASSALGLGLLLVLLAFSRRVLG